MRERCPKCGTAMSDEELGTGICLLCEEEVLAPQSPPAVSAEAKTTQPTSGGFSVAAIVAGIVVLLTLCLVPFGLIVYFEYLDRPATPNDPDAAPAKKKGPIAQAKKSDFQQGKKTIVASEETKSDSEQKKDPKSKTDGNPKDITNKTDKSKEEAKKEKPKKVEPKVVENIVKHPEPILVAPNRRLANIRRVVDGAIKIDGDLSDWKEIAPLELRGIERGKPTKNPVAAPKSQKAWLAYDSRGILIAAEVVDTSGAIENLPKPTKGGWAFWDNDAIEVYIDTLNLRARGRGEPNAHQFFAFPLGVPNDTGIGGYESRCLVNTWSIVTHASTGKDAMLRAGKKIPNGWTIEFLIPKAALRHAEIKPGQIFGFELQIDTGTNLFYFWANDDPAIRVSTSPFVWGEAIFGGSDAVIDLLGVGRRPAKVIIPGQPITVRVADPDRNLNPQIRDSIEVALVSKSGDRKSLKLDESAPNSGVFVGSIATRLNIGKREANVFEVVAGENIVVEYLDAIRVNGDRNVLQRVQFPVRP